MVVLDRGYPSFETLCYLEGSPADYAVRVRLRDGFPAVRRFVESGARDADIEITVPVDYRARDVAPVRVRAVRLDRGDRDPVVVLTSLPRDAFGAAHIGDLYRRRWAVEEYFKLVKGTYLGQGGFHARTPDGVEQEVFAQALFVSISRHLMAAAARQHTVPYDKLSQKRGILAAAERLTDLLLCNDQQTATRLINRLCKRIASRRDPPRPGRSFPRRSFRAIPKWGPNGRRGAGA